jgi:hypothetical protein
MLILALAGGSALAGTYEFAPTPSNLWQLDHYYYYSWGFNINIPANETIVDGVLSFDNINNWTQEANNQLYIHLVDDPTIGTYWYWDNQGGGDNLAAAGPLVGTYHDSNASQNEDLNYSLSQLGLLDTFKAYAADGTAGFGFDPDCHYYNCGVKFTVTTRAVPEPSSLALLLTGGLPMLGFALRRRFKK